MQRLTLIDKSTLAINESKVIKADTYSKLIDVRALLAEADDYTRQRRAAIEAEVAQARELGYQEGLTKANHDFAVRMTDSVMRLEATYIGLEARLVNTVMNALKSVLGSLDEHLVIEKMVRQLIQAAGQEKKLALRVSAEQFDAVNEVLKSILADYPYIEFIDVVNDPHMRLGDCVIETEYGAVDGSLDQQLNVIRQSLISVFSGRRAGTARDASVSSHAEPGSDVKAGS